MNTLERGMPHGTARNRRIERARLARDHADLAADLKRLSRGRRALQIGSQWLVITLAVMLAEMIDAVWVSVLAMLVIATRQHALLVLMHDAAHVLISRDKRRNDLISNVLLAFCMTLSTSRYRTHHMNHHKHLNTPADPDYADSYAPPSRGFLWRALLRDLSGLSTLDSLRTMDHFSVFGLFSTPVSSSRAERLQAIIFFISALIVIAWFQAWQGVLLYWVAPLLFFLAPILRIRSLSEHAGLSARSVMREARSVSPGWLERCLFAPCNINRHWEHHLFERVPNYALETLSRRLALRLPDSAAACNTEGYLLGKRCVLAELFRDGSA